MHQRHLKEWQGASCRYFELIIWDWYFWTISLLFRVKIWQPWLVGSKCWGDVPCNCSMCLDVIHDHFDVLLMCLCYLCSLCRSGGPRSKQQEAFLLSVVNQTAASCENISTIEAFCGLKEESCDCKHGSSLDQVYNKMVIVHVHYEFRGERIPFASFENDRIDNQDWPLRLAPSLAAITINRTW